MQTSSINKQSVFTQIEKLILQGGPTRKEFALVDGLVNEISELAQQEMISKADLDVIRSQCDFINDPLSIMGHIRCKPYGYAGDFEIIDRIYQHNIKEDKYANWDTYSLNNSAAQAVRNRKSYFKAMMAEKLSTSNTPIELLDVASGPARDLFEMYNSMTNPEQVATTCVELDATAIAFAEKLNHPHLDQIEFLNANIFRFKTEQKFDVIWSAGLFDYFDDKAFKFVLSRFKTWLQPGGEIVIGNFNEDHNPSRPYMEIWGDWFLNHRTAKDLERLAIESGFDHKQVSVGREPENINLFLHIKG